MLIVEYATHKGDSFTRPRSSRCMATSIEKTPSGRPADYKRSLSLIPESASSANEQVIFTVIGEDAWNFADVVVKEAMHKFPTLCGGTADPNHRTSESGFEAKISTERVSKISSISSSSSRRASGEANPKELVETDKAPLSCKFWLDGLKELEPLEEEETSPTFVFSAEDRQETKDTSDAQSTAEDLAGRLRKEIECEISEVESATEPCDPKVIMPTDPHKSTNSKAVSSGSGPNWARYPSELSQGSSVKGSAMKKNGDRQKDDVKSPSRKSVKMTPSSTDGKRKSLTRSGEEALSGLRKKSVMSVMSAGRRISNVFARKTLDNDDDSDCDSEEGVDAKRTVVSARYFPVESFSEEVPICKTLKQFKESVMLFLVDKRKDEEISQNERMSNLRFRKGEVERWVQFAMRHHHAPGAPAMLCILLMHESPEREISVTSFDPVSSFDADCGNATKSMATNCSMKVNYSSTTDLKALPGNLPENGVVRTEPEDSVDAPYLSFVEDLRKAIDAPACDKLQYKCNFDDPDATLKFILRLTSTVIDRRKDDPNCTTSPHQFLSRLTAEMEKNERRRCRRCRSSCVVV